MNVDLMFSILGLIGGFLCCGGDLFLDLKGSDNQKLGTSKQLDSNWLKMSEWRFGVSILLAMIGVPFTGLGVYSLFNQMTVTKPVLANVTLLLAFLGCCGGFFIHAFLCVQAIIVKRIMQNEKDIRSYEEKLTTADNVLEGMYKAILFPFFLFYFCLMGSTVCVSIGILTNALLVPKWMIILNPIPLMIFGITLRKIHPKWFCDLPGIIMPSFGLAMQGLIGIVALCL